MDIFRFSEKLMAMDGEVWARHANPWSVYSRMSCLPLIVVAIWSRIWIGWWSLIPLVIAFFWTWYNPRIASKSGSKQTWAYKGVMGERLFLNRKTTAIPIHHQQMAYLLTVMSVVGGAMLAYGLFVLNGWATMSGLLVTIGSKLWFVDRMVWLYQDRNSSS